MIARAVHRVAAVDAADMHAVVWARGAIENLIFGAAGLVPVPVEVIFWWLGGYFYLLFHRNNS